MCGIKIEPLALRINFMRNFFVLGPVLAVIEFRSRGNDGVLWLSRYRCVSSSCIEHQRLVKEWQNSN